MAIAAARRARGLRREAGMAAADASYEEVRRDVLLERAVEHVLPCPCSGRIAARLLRQMILLNADIADVH